MMRFNERKATQAAAFLLKIRGGRMSYLKLIKLLYLADRAALARWGRPITTDRHVSMNHGPVLSRVLDLVNDGDAPGEEVVWDAAVTARLWPTTRCSSRAIRAMMSFRKPRSPCLRRFGRQYRPHGPLGAC